MNQHYTQQESKFRCKGKIYLAVMEWNLLLFSQ